MVAAVEVEDERVDLALELVDEVSELVAAVEVALVDDLEDS